MWHYLTGHPNEIIPLVALALASLAAFVAGIGYSRIGMRILVCAVIAFTGGALTGFITLLLGLALEPKGEWAGIASLVLGWMVGFTIGFLLLVLSAWLLIYKPRAELKRGNRSIVFLGIATLCAGSLGFRISTYVPSTYSDSNLARMMLEGASIHGKVDPSNELSLRGEQAVPYVIEELQKYPASEAREFESARNGGLMNTLVLLGRIGGAEAIRELRLWLHREDAAPDVRASAASGLAQANDRESAPPIAAFLKEESYEWHKQRPILYNALSMLHATEQIPEIRASLLNETTDLYVSNGVQCLLAMKTPEADAVVLELGSSSNNRIRTGVLNALAQAPPSREFTQLLLDALSDPDPTVRWAACVSLLGSTSSSSRYPEVWKHFEYGACSGVDSPDWTQKVGTIRNAVSAQLATEATSEQDPIP
jgi:HEAT repeat protein